MNKFFTSSVFGIIIGTFIGVVGVLLAINSYIFDIQSKQIELQSLLLDAEKVTEYKSTYSVLNKKIVSLEKHFLKNENIRIYYEDELSIPLDIKEKYKIIELITNAKNTDNDKQYVVSYISQNDNKYISQLAAEKHIELFDKNDIDITVRLSITSDIYTSNILRGFIIKTISDSNYLNIEKALLKYMELDDQIASFLIEDIKFKENSLYKFRDIAINKNLQYCIMVIDTKLLQLKKDEVINHKKQKDITKPRS